MKKVLFFMFLFVGLGFLIQNALAVNFTFQAGVFDNVNTSALNGASVNVSFQTNGTQVYSLTTNSSGFTPQISLVGNINYTVIAGKTGYISETRNFNHTFDRFSNFFLNPTGVSRIDCLVLDEQTLLPIQNAQVSVFFSNNTLAPLVNSFNTSINPQYTASGGTCSYPIVPNGQYFITAQATGYAFEQTSLFTVQDANVNLTILMTQSDATLTLGVDRLSGFKDDLFTFSFLSQSLVPLQIIYSLFIIDNNDDTHQYTYGIPQNSNGFQFPLLGSSLPVGTDMRVYGTAYNVENQTIISNDIFITVLESFSGVGSVTPEFVDEVTTSIPFINEAELSEQGLAFLLPFFSPFFLSTFVLMFLGMIGEAISKSGGKVFLGVTLVGTIFLFFIGLMPIGFMLLIVLIVGFMFVRMVMGGIHGG